MTQVQEIYLDVHPDVTIKRRVQLTEDVFLDIGPDGEIVRIGAISGDVIHAEDLVVVLREIYILDPEDDFDD